MPYASWILHTSSSIGPHVFGKSDDDDAATTTAVCVGSTVFTVKSTVMARSIRRGRQPTCATDLVGTAAVEPPPCDDLDRRLST
jgi:hypothetical protein